jgi:hypothetical protein
MPKDVIALLEVTTPGTPIEAAKLRKKIKEEKTL